MCISIFSSLFDEAEVNADEEVVSEKCQTVVKEHARAKRGRKPKDVQLPIKEEIHELADEDRACTTCGSLRPVILRPFVNTKNKVV